MNASDAQAAEPYPGPRPFATREAMLFYGRRRECADVVDLVLAYRAVVLYAPSAAGKSSLVNAGVVPALRPAGVEVLPPARVGGELLPGVGLERVGNLFLFNLWASWLPAAAQLDEAHAAALRAGDLLSLLPRAAAGDGTEPGQARLLFIDQFEELFRASPEHWRERADFCRAVGAALRADQTLRLLLAIREDYLAELDPYADCFPDSLRIRYRIERLREQQALEATVEPARQANVTFAPGVAEGLVRELRQVHVRTRVGSRLETRPIEGEFVEPVHLQVVCQDVWRKKGDAGVISAATAKAGDVDSALGRFYERAVQVAARGGAVREDAIRKWVDEKLITPAGTRGTVYYGDRDTAGLPNPVVSVLERERILRAEPRAGAIWYELTHDRFIGPIRTCNRRRRQRQRKRRDRLVGLGACLVVLAGLVAALTLAYLGDSRAQAVVAQTTSDGDTLRALAMEVEQQGDAASLRRASAGYGAAIAAYERTGQTTAGARALLDRARVLCQLGRPDEALADYRAASRQYALPGAADPAALLRDASSFGQVGRALYEARAIPEAIDALRRASDLAARAGEPGAAGRAVADTDLSLALAREHDYRAARQAFDRVLQSGRTSPAVSEAATTGLESEIRRFPLTTQAYANLARLAADRGNHFRAVETIDRGIEVASANADPILVQLRATRLDLLERAYPALSATLPPMFGWAAPALERQLTEERSRLREYVCRHNAYVIAASERQAGVEEEVRRMRRDFPLARAGDPVGDQVPIVADSFLTCEEAAALLKTIQAKYRTYPFVGRVYSGCPGCPGLPALMQVR